MKTYAPVLIIALLTSLFFLRCAKTPPPEKLKTRLMIRLGDDEGKSVAGTVVRLYKNAMDTGIVRIADSTGKLYYPDLEPTLYYWFAEKGCKNNRRSQTTLNRPLIDGIILYGYSVLSANGTLKVTNNAAEPYKLSDSTFSITLPADTTWFGYPKIGVHKLHAEKVSTPGIGKDSLVQIKCGDTTVINLPF
jgi:hypothetical protein